MKITNFMQPVQAPQQSRTITSGKQPAQAGKQAPEGRPVKVTPKHHAARPAEVLSKDELQMLQRLFPDSGRAASFTEVYSRDRKQIRMANVGILVDVKQ